MRLVLLGPPGAGKGTQGARLSARLGVPQIATGDIFREARESGSELGRRVADYLDAGELVPDELTNEVVERRLGMPDTQRGFVLDGYPRTPEQVEALDAMLERQGQALDGVLRFMVTGDEIVARLSARRICPVCNSVYHMKSDPPAIDEVCDRDGSRLIHREDDREETVRHRLEVYGLRTKPLVELYGRRGLLIEVDGLGAEDEVFERLVGALPQTAQ